LRDCYINALSIRSFISDLFNSLQIRQSIYPFNSVSINLFDLYIYQTINALQYSRVFALFIMFISLTLCTGTTFVQFLSLLSMHLKVILLELYLRSYKPSSSLRKQYRCEGSYSEGTAGVMCM